MPIDKQRTLLYLQEEWGTYVERFNCLPEEEKASSLKEQGFESFRDLLAHILGWWEEGMDIIHSIAEGRPFERKKYDFDIFNAESVAKYSSWDETEFMAYFEATRLKMESDLKSMDETVFVNRRVKAWIQAVIIHHAREHLISLSRFLVVDLLENEWGTYLEDFNRLDIEKQKEFLAKQGFESFHDLLAHIVGWWEEGARIIRGIIDRPGFTWESHDVDTFNADLTEKYSEWSDDDLFKHFENVRLALIGLISELPAHALSNEEIKGWLKDDIVVHYDEHPMPV